MTVPHDAVTLVNSPTLASGGPDQNVQTLSINQPGMQLSIALAKVIEEVSQLGTGDEATKKLHSDYVKAIQMNDVIGATYLIWDNILNWLEEGRLDKDDLTKILSLVKQQQEDDFMVKELIQSIETKIASQSENPSA